MHDNEAGWHYAQGGQAMGPHTAAEMARLRAQGLLNDDTPVWRPGMAQWTPWAQSALAGQPAAADRQAGAPPPRYTPRGLQRPWFWGALLQVASLCLGALFVILVQSDTPGFLSDPQLWFSRSYSDLETISGQLAVACGLVGALMLLVLLYRLWALVQDGRARTTPARAVGFSFIPLFEIYWEFIAVGGLAEEMRAFAARHGLEYNPPGAQVAGVYCWTNVAAGLVPFTPDLPFSIGIFISALVWALFLFSMHALKNAGLALLGARGGGDAQPKQDQAQPAPADEPTPAATEAPEPAETQAQGPGGEAATPPEAQRLWWHRAPGPGQPAAQGPFSEAHMRQLRAQGGINDQTLVWRPGLPNPAPWALSELASPAPAAREPLPATKITAQGLGALWAWTAWLYAGGLVALTYGRAGSVFHSSGDAVVLGSFLLLALGELTFLAGGILWLVLLHRLWSLVPPGLARTRPWAAVLMMFVPVVNLYYLFINLSGLAKDLNKTLAHYQAPGPAADTRKATLAAFFILLVIVLGYALRMGVFAVVLVIPAAYYFVAANRAIVATGRALASRTQPADWWEAHDA